MAKVYLAAQYIQMHEMHEVAKQLREAGHIVTSNWINGDEEKMSHQQAAAMDLADIEAADILLSYSLPPRTPHTGGGRHVEFGYGLAIGKALHFIGPKGETVFHYLPGVIHFPSLEDWINYHA